MGSRRHDRVSELFLKACELPVEQQQAFLDGSCADDPELRAEVEALLRHDEPSLLKTGGGVQRAASMLAALAGTGCASCGNPIPEGFDDCPSCKTTFTLTPDLTVSIPGYAVVRLLDSGAMGEVYLAEETALGRLVAIKVVSGHYAHSHSMVQRFLREARTMATVEHPHIVRVYSFGEVEGRSYLVMEYVEGECLARKIRRQGKLETDESLNILRQAVDGLEAVWEHGIIHRDIKPANILLDAHGRVRVADFGLAKATEVETDSSLTQVGQVVGTPHYLSPEQARGEKGLDFRTDVYSLGIVLYEMLTGERPFSGETPITIVDQHLHTPLPAVRSRTPEVPGQIEQLCEWMTQKRPDDRPASYADLKRSVDGLLGRPGAELETTGALPSLPAAEQRPATFVGRSSQLGSLRHSLDMTLAGEGQMVFVTGEAGSGKTALITEFARQAQESHEDLIVALGNCDAQTGTGDPYLPFREMLGLLTADIEFRAASGAISREHARRLWGLLPLAVEALVDNGPDLLGRFISGEALVSRSAAFTPSPARWRVRLEELVRRSAETPRDVGLQQSYLFEQYARTLHALARKHPLLLQIEDLHWADGGSCSLLFHLGRRLARGRILIVATFRPAEIGLEREGRRHPMSLVVNELRRLYGELEIGLGEEETREFTDELLDSEPNDLTDVFRERLYRQTRGHPLFTVELIGSMRQRDMLTQDDAGRWIEGPAMDWETLPARVEGAVAERIGRLPEALRKTLTLASVQGEEFVAEVLARLEGRETREIVAVLSGELDKRHRLVATQGIRRMNGQRVSTYRFRHNLFQIYLYGQMDETERAYTHEDVGTALEALYADRTDEVATQLARHFHEAGITPKAIRYLQRAGERATRLSANEEAIDHLRRALTMLDASPDIPDRDRQELTLQLDLGPPLLGTAGPGSEDLSRAYFRARELCDRVGTPQQLFQTLFLLVHHHANQGRGQTALELAEQLLDVVERAEEPLPEVMAHWARGFVLLYYGGLADSLAQHDRVIEIYDPDVHTALAFIFGMDPAVSSLSFGGVALWTLGYPDRAMEYSRRGVAHARNVNQPMTLAHALLQAAYLGMIRRDTELLPGHTEELVRLSTEHGVALFRAWGVIAEGWLLSEHEEHEAGIARMRQGIDDCRATGSVLGHTMASSMLAEVQRRAGRLDEGIASIADAISMIGTTGERLHEPEAHRVKGQLLLDRDGRSAAPAEAAFRRAIELARAQGARAWELRSAISLGRLMESRGRLDEARALLSDVHGWFNEGFETPDLKQASALLDAWS